MRLALSGLGKAGKSMVEAIGSSPADDLVLAVCRNESKSAGKSIGEVLGLVRMDAPIVSLEQANGLLKQEKIDVLIDFSHESFTSELLHLCQREGCNLVICTTDHDEETLAEIERVASEGNIGIVYAPTLTLGVNLLLDFASKMSRVLSDFDFAIVERHRRDKPPISATARVIASKVEKEDVPISYIRAGGYVGVHELTAASAEERLTIVHESFSRGAFAKGALLAAQFIDGRQGLYSMADVVSDLAFKEN